MLLCKLVGVEYSCWQYTGKLAILESSIQHNQATIDVAGTNNPNVIMLGTLGCCLHARFECLGNLPDIECSITIFQQVVDLVHDDHPDKSDWLSNLRAGLVSCIHALGNSVDIDRAISILQRAADCVRDGSLDMLAAVYNLSCAQIAHFKRSGQLQDIKMAINNLIRAVKAANNHPDWLCQLSTAYLHRFDHLGMPSDLEACILVAQQAADLTATASSTNTTIPTVLGLGYLSCYQCLHAPEDIEICLQISSTLSSLHLITILTWGCICPIEVLLFRLTLMHSITSQTLMLQSVMEKRP